MAVTTADILSIWAPTRPACCVCGSTARPASTSFFATPRRSTPAASCIRRTCAAPSSATNSSCADGLRGARAAVHVPRLSLRGGERRRRSTHPRRACSARPRARSAGSSAPTRWSTSCSRTSLDAACAPTSSACRPTARSATSGSAGPPTRRSSPPTALFNADVSNMLDKWLDDMVDAQLPSGAYPDVAPAPAGYAGAGNAAGATPA